MVANNYIFIHGLRNMYVIRLQNTGIYRIYNSKPLSCGALASLRSGTTKDLKIINSIVPCVLNSNFYHRHVLAPFASAVTAKHPESTVVITISFI